MWGGKKTRLRSFIVVNYTLLFLFFFFFHKSAGILKCLVFPLFTSRICNAPLESNKTNLNLPMLFTHTGLIIYYFLSTIVQYPSNTQNIFSWWTCVLAVISHRFRVIISMWPSKYVEHGLREFKSPDSFTFQRNLNYNLYACGGLAIYTVWNYYKI